MSIKHFLKSSVKSNEKGAALVIALMVMVILLGITALVFSRTMSENTISNNDEVESLTFNAAEAALETSTRDFATVVENKFLPTTADIYTIEHKPVPYFSDNGYTFDTKITPTGQGQVITLTKGQFQGLVSMRDQWQIDVTANDTRTGVETQLRRRYFNDRIPIFQFGAFYQDDIELYDPPTFIFNGRVHTNGNFFAISNGNDIRFKSKITTAGEFIRDRWKTGAGLGNGETSAAVFAPNTVNVDTSIPTDRGSVTCTATIGGGLLTDITGRNFPYPNCTTNPNWATFKTNFENNLITKAKILSLPVFKLNVPLIEMIRRGKNIGDKANIGGNVSNVAAHENGTLSRERYSNKEGIRVSLADSRDRLPQCVNVDHDDPCGVRLDGTIGNSRGYTPLPMTDGYQATTLNGNRLAVNTSVNGNNREVWIKIEMVDFDYDNQKPIATDITKDILSLGVTEPIIEPATPNLIPGPPSSLPLNTNLKVYNALGNAFGTDLDSRSIIKLQRFAIKGTPITNGTATSYLTSQTLSSTYNFVVRKQNVPPTGLVGCNLPTLCTDKDVFVAPVVNGGNTSGGDISTDESAHYKVASFDNGVTKKVIVPFPIEMYDTREGNRTNSTAGTTANFLYKNGVMSIVDIDVANLRRFLNGEFNGKFPTNTPFASTNGNVGLKSTDIPQNRGWVLYVSDRRGDFNFDGRYNMEDVNAGSNSLIEEDIDNNGQIDVDYANEAPNADSQVVASMAAVTDHSFNRRAVRLINGGVLPGNYDSVTKSNTKGFTFAAENGTYVLGNYNVGSGFSANVNGTPPSAYLPFNSTLHIPASIAADAVYILSNNWNDAKSFQFGHDLTQRVATPTQVRFAMLAGDSLVGSTPTVAGLDPTSSGFNGGLHNFKRFLETWTNVRMNYSGSLINLFNASNNNGRHKSNGITYNPPIRDWTFEDSFTDPFRIPPGTPFVYFTTFTGFERVNE
jgi:type II secretory pathway pseudopilin PulG